MKHTMDDRLSEMIDEYVLYSKVCHVPEEWRNNKGEYLTSNFVHDAIRRKREYENYIGENKND